MRKKVFCRLLYCVLLVMCFHITASAEFYRYTDNNGNLIFTDDFSRIPANQRDKITAFNSVQPVDKPPDETDDGSLAETLSVDAVSAQREGLEREYFHLQQARKALMEEKANVTTLVEQQAYNEKVIRLNQQIELFSQQLDRFNKTVSGDPGVE